MTFTTAPLALAQLVHQAARQHDRREEVHLKHVVPDLARGVDRAEPLAAFGLGRDRGVVDQRMQLAVVEPVLDLGDRRIGARGVGEIDLDVILRAHLPRAVFRKAVARAGDHAPAGGGEALHRRVADAAACAGEQQGAARLVGIGIRHSALSRIHPHLAPRLAERVRAGTRCGRAGGTAGRARTRSTSARCGSRTSAAGAARCRARISPRRARPPSRRRAGFPAGATAGSPRRRSARPSAGWRNRRRPPPRVTRSTGPRMRTCRFSDFQ